MAGSHRNSRAEGDDRWHPQREAYGSYLLPHCGSPKGPSLTGLRGHEAPTLHHPVTRIKEIPANPSIIETNTRQKTFIVINKLFKYLVLLLLLTVEQKVKWSRWIICVIDFFTYSQYMTPEVWWEFWEKLGLCYKVNWDGFTPLTMCYNIKHNANPHWNTWVPV